MGVVNARRRVCHGRICVHTRHHLGSEDRLLRPRADLPTVNFAVFRVAAASAMLVTLARNATVFS
jgi:hypothetical protein